MKAIETASIMLGMITKIVYHRSDAVQTSACRRVGFPAPTATGGCLEDGGKVIDTDWKNSGSLSKKTVSPCKAANYVHDMSMALEVIHSENIAQRDLKTDYIVLVMRFRSAVLLVLAALAIATGFHAQR